MQPGTTLDFNYEYKVKYCLNTSIRKMQLPLKFDTLKTKNNELYVLLRKSNNDQIMKID